MKSPFILLGATSILLLLTGCASADISARNESRGARPVSSSSLVNEHAESIRQANPEANAYAIAKRRLVGPDKPSKRELKQRAARQEFQENLADVLGTP